MAGLLLALCLVIAGRAAGFTLNPILSGSMGQAIPTGSLALIGPVPNDDITVGDVIVYQPQDMQVRIAHRVTDIITTDGQRSVRTQGDANNAPEPHLFALTGQEGTKVYASVPRLGYVAEFLAGAHGRQALFTMALACLLLALLPLGRRNAQPTKEQSVA